jgi:hypothetical protein
VSRFDIGVYASTPWQRATGAFLSLSTTIAIAMNLFGSRIENVTRDNLSCRRIDDEHRVSDMANTTYIASLLTSSSMS